VKHKYKHSTSKERILFHLLMKEIASENLKLNEITRPLKRQQSLEKNDPLRVRFS